MTLHKSTFEYLKPTQQQIITMSLLRQASADFAANLNDNLPDGPDKTYIMRELRALSMWVNVAVTRNADGTPRT